MQLIGITPPVEQYSKVASKLFDIRLGNIYVKLAKTGQVCITGMLFGLFVFRNHTLQPLFYITVFLCCSCTYFLNGYVLANTFGKFLGNQLSIGIYQHFQQIVEAVSSSELFLSEMADSLKQISSDYQHTPQFIDQQINLMLGSYGYILGVGPLLSTLAKLMCDPGLIKSNTMQFSVKYILSIVNFTLILLVLIIGLKQAGNTYIIFISVFGVVYAIVQFDNIAGNRIFWGIDKIFARKQIEGTENKSYTQDELEPI
ncbi:Hypothetical_protein [Hexamita inflata]|uniref:Hypothetical_protein n=1 Tax=Hexamita inflata TaxID=28002 RepID=A0AA86Q624_9EUKA|nr:Hypothetical protein HINF_LOCUS40461 [Hexamita inflata]